MKKYSTEHIEKYLEHHLTQTEKQEFERALSQNQDLQKEVEAQRKIAATLAFSGFQSAVHAAHDRFENGVTTLPTSETLKTKTGWSFTQFFGVFILIAIGVIGIWKLTDHKQTSNDKPTAIQKQVSISPKKETPSETEKVEVNFNSYTFLAEKGTTINDPRSGAKITIKPNSLVHKTTNEPVKGNVKLTYREFRDQADIALSEIPMDYKDKFFNSAGMFEMRSTQGEETLAVKDGEEIGIDFKMTKNEDGIGFYELNDDSQKWKKLKDLPKENRTRSKAIEPSPKATKATSILNPVSLIAKEPNRSLIAVTPENTPYLDPKITSLAKELSPIEEVTNTAKLEKGNWNSTSALNSSPKELFFNESYSQPVGDAFNNISKMNFKSKTFVDPTPINIEIVSQKKRKKNSKKKHKKNNKKSAISGNSYANNSIDIPEWSNPFSVVTQVDTVTIFDNSSSVFFKELEPLKDWVFYDRENNIYRGNDIFDIRIDLDSTDDNRFLIHLKHSNGITSAPVSLILGKMTRQILQRHYENYLTLRNARMQRVTEKANLYQQKVENLKNAISSNSDHLDDLIEEKDSKIYAIAQLTMTDKELEMSKEEWFEQMATDSLAVKRLKNSLQKINDYSNNKPGASDSLVDLIQRAEIKQANLFYLKKVRKLAQASAFIVDQPKKLTYSNHTFIKTMMSKSELLLTFAEWKDLMISSKDNPSNRYRSFNERVDTMTSGYKEFYLSIYQNHAKNMKQLRENKKSLARLQEINQIDKDVIAKDKVDKGTLSAGHYKDPLVRELAIKDFGVFNCDQVNRIADAVQINAQYICNGNTLANNRVLTVIDKAINGALSFDPKLPTMSTSSNTCLLLVTKDDRYYFYSSEDWNKKKPQQKGEHQFEMTEIKIKKPEDLQALIEGKHS